MKFLLSLLTGGDFAPIGYIIGIASLLLGIIAVCHTTNSLYLVLAIFFVILGAIVLFLRVKKDVEEIRKTIE